MYTHVCVHMYIYIYIYTLLLFEVVITANGSESRAKVLGGPQKELVVAPRMEANNMI